MIRLLFHGLAVLHLGPGVAFAWMALGCGGDLPWLDDWCGDGSIAYFLQVTVVVWLVLGAASAWWLRVHARPPAGPAPAGSGSAP